MWLMLTTGALSVVQRDPRTMDKDDPRTLVVRARRREYLDTFRDKYCPQLTESLHLDNKDYQWRGYVSPDELAVAVARAILSIDYHNFKAATQSAEHGLPDAKLRDGLHDAYSKCWSALLTAGDGTSAYNYTVTGIEACYRWGHWWPKGEKFCKDCGESNPSYPKAGPEKVYPKRPAKGKTSRKRKAKRQGTVKTYTQPVLKSSDGCEGSWQEPDADSVVFPTAYNGYQETGVCWFCGQRVKLAPDGVLELHWENDPAIS